MPAQANSDKQNYDVIVIGSGFGGTMVALSVARAFLGTRKRVHILERGTWWTTPVGTVADPEVKVYDHLKTSYKQEPGAVQFWPAVNHFRGLVDIVTRCVRRKRNPDGLFDIAIFGKKTLFGLVGRGDGLSIIHASGVGGGSLVYSNITIRPPDFVLDDPRWPTWPKPQRDADYQLARNAIGRGVLWALDTEAGIAPPAMAVNPGLSNIVTRTARLNPNWANRTDPNNPPGVYYESPIPPARSPSPAPAAAPAPVLAPASTPASAPAPPFDANHLLWLDRARVFQAAASRLTRECGAVDLSISDQPPEWTNVPGAQPPGQAVRNYCERQGRCNVGCLPGARFTLNKQLMAAVLGTPALPGAPPHDPALPNLTLTPLVEVQSITYLGDDKGYRIDCRHTQRQSEKRVLFARQVVISAGCVNTNELMLRCRDLGTLPNVSPEIGHHFSGNGDYLAFLEKANVRVGLTRGPVTTSFAHFNTDSNARAFHTVEDQGVPPAMASLIGYSEPFIRSLSRGRHPVLLVISQILRWLGRRAIHFIRAPLLNKDEQQPEFMTPEQRFSNMLCVVGMGRDASEGVFRRGKGAFDTPLRLSNPAGHQFADDPIYHAIQDSLDEFSRELGGNPYPQKNSFQNPFFTTAAKQFLGQKTVMVSHPLGGCSMAPADRSTGRRGVIDSSGRVFDTARWNSTDESKRCYPGLYIADASIIPTALGVNPSLTISALALRVARTVIAEARSSAPVS